MPGSDGRAYTCAVSNNRNMGMKSILGLLLAAALLGGCAVYTPHGAAVVDPPDRGGGFCPPGQAKKGNC
ncbi:vir-repressed protein [Bordetella pertussis]|nr:vir-repressed protein [Bordetella pertussis]CFP60289.1 vir-repressed protein [Bordetella pertussis]